MLVLKAQGLPRASDVRKRWRHQPDFCSNDAHDQSHGINHPSSSNGQYRGRSDDSDETHSSKEQGFLRECCSPVCASRRRARPCIGKTVSSPRSMPRARPSSPVLLRLRDIWQITSPPLRVVPWPARWESLLRAPEGLVTANRPWKVI
jgi:hypothetical protein